MVSIGRTSRQGWSLVRQTVDLWLEKQAFQQAGALAFYTLFSMAPLLIVLIALIGVVFGEEAARGEVAAFVDDTIGPQAAEAVQGAIRRSRMAEAGLLPTVLGVGALLFGATTVFAQLQASLNHFWDVRARPTRSSLVGLLMTRLISLGLVLVIGFVLLVSFVVTAALAAIIRFAEDWMPIPAIVVTAIDFGVSLVVATLLFAMIYKILPDVRLEWRDMWLGAGITAVLFVGGQALIARYLAETAPASTYGAAGSLVVVLFWVYYSSLILFFGAAFTRTAVRRRGGRLMPKATAVKVQTVVVENVGDDGPAESPRRGGPEDPHTR